MFEKPKTPRKKSSSEEVGHKQSTLPKEIINSPKKKSKNSIQGQNDIELNVSAGEDACRSSYSIEFKLQIVEEAKELDNNTLVARKHGISEGAVRSWRKNEDKLSKHSSEIRGLCSTKCSSEMLQNLLYFMHKKTHEVFFFAFHFVQLYIFT